MSVPFEGGLSENSLGQRLRRVHSLELESQSQVDDLWLRLHVGEEPPVLRGSWSPSDVVRRVTALGVEWIVPIPLHRTESGHSAQVELEVRW